MAFGRRIAELELTNFLLLRPKNMPPKRDANITSFFQPKGGEKGKSTAGEPTPNPHDDTSEVDSTKQEGKGKGKRLSSTSPHGEKRRATKPVPEHLKTHFSPKDLPPNWLTKDPEKITEGSKPTLSVTVHKGDLFGGATTNALLIHACNTQGSWGAGIARAFRDRYPEAYKIYRDFCTKEHNPRTNPIPTGTALLIPPLDVGKSHWVGCLFTSAKYGRAKARPEVIVRDTVPAMQVLLELVRLAEEVSEVRMCKINSGLFGVPWEKTTEALEGIEVQEGWKTSVDVWEP